MRLDFDAVADDSEHVSLALDPLRVWPARVRAREAAVAVPTNRRSVDSTMMQQKFPDLSDAMRNPLL